MELVADEMLARHLVERAQHRGIADAAPAHGQQELHAADAVVAYGLSWPRRPRLSGIAVGCAVTSAAKARALLAAGTNAAASHWTFGGSVIPTLAERQTRDGAIVPT